MCGITGIALGPRDGFERRDLERMTGAIAHRGPDDEGFLFDERVWLGVRRLSIIDVEHGKQPMFSEDASVAVVYNGEIYNFKDLAKTLNAKGHRLSTGCDTEVIAHLYEEYGADCVDHLSGMFAFAVWDRRRHRLLLARDRMGIKPLYYVRTPGDGLAFASEMRSLLRLPGLNREVDPDGLRQFLTFDATPAPRTVLRGINKLAAGTCVMWDGREARTKRYWSLREIPVGVGPRRPEEAEAALRDLMQDVVRRHLVSDVPLGVFLSGGLDSSYVTAAVTRLVRERVQTFSIGFEEESFDESAYARRVAEKLGTEHHEERLPAAAALHLIPRLPDIMDEPLGDPAVLPTYLLARAARRHVTVVLSGEGSDELFYGYPTYYAHRYAQRLERWMPRAGLDVVRRVAQRLPASTRNFAFDFVAKRFLSGLGHDLVERHAIWMSSIPPEEQGLLTPEIREQLEDGPGFDPAHDAAAAAPDGADDLTVVSQCDLALYLQDGILMRTDKASMMNSLEVRVPFLDPDVVRFARGLPDGLKLHGRTGKYLLRRIARGTLPAEVVNRPKKGFGVPVADWFRGPLREMLRDVLSEPSLRVQGIFQPQSVTKLLDEHEAGRQNHRKALWVLFVFQLWYRQVVCPR